MNFDARDIIEVNLALLQEAAAKTDPPPPVVLVSIATWGRGADPKVLATLQPYRIGLGFNGSLVARLPRALALEILPAAVGDQIEAASGSRLPVCGGVFKDWLVDLWPDPEVLS